MSETNTDTGNAPDEAPTPADYAAWSAEHAAAREQQDQNTSENGPRAGREAAKYRRALRAAEAERDTLRGRVESFQRAEAERLAAERLAQPADLWTFGTELADLTTEDGSIDTGAVSAAVERLLADRPGLERGAAVRFPDIGQGRRASAESVLSWADVLRK